METITLHSFQEYSDFITNNPTFQINDVNIISNTEIIVTYTQPTP